MCARVCVCARVLACVCVRERVCMRVRVCMGVRVRVRCVCVHVLCVSVSIREAWGMRLSVLLCLCKKSEDLVIQRLKIDITADLID